MATVRQIPKAKPNQLSPGMASLLSFIYETKKPKIVEISKGAVPFKINSSWNFDVPIASLNKVYQ